MKWNEMGFIFILGKNKVEIILFFVTKIENEVKFFSFQWEIKFQKFFNQNQNQLKKVFFFEKCAKRLLLM